MTWHYEKNGIRHDNVTEDDITGLIARGELTAATLVWRQGMTDWQPVSATPLACALLKAPSRPHCRGTAFRAEWYGRWHLLPSLVMRLSCGRQG
jgi:hypothetical protein